MQENALSSSKIKDMVIFINWGINNEAEAIKDFIEVTSLTVGESGL